MKTTEVIKELKNCYSEWVMPTHEFINQAVQMADLLERSEFIIRQGESPSMGLSVPHSRRRCSEWLADFEKFQEGK